MYIWIPLSLNNDTNRGTMKDKDLIQLLRLSLIDRIGPAIGKKLLAYLGGAEGVFKASKQDFTQIDGVGEVHYALVKASKTEGLAQEVLEQNEKHGIQTLAYSSADYPHRLKNCMDAPMILYYSGQEEQVNRTRVVSIVGTRSASPYGIEFTEDFVEKLVERDVLVTSGLAFGIDACAHRSALKYGGQTVGVVAHGLDRVSPSLHKALAEKMKRQGGILSEHRTGIKVEKGFFPMRNRLVAGMCDAVVVVESDLKGGSLITARMANDYNRDVFALPGRIHDRASRGCNALIQKNSAHILNDVEEFMRMMSWEEKEKNVEVQMPLFVDLEGTEKQIFELLDREPKTVDKISVESERPMSEVSATLLALEFKGLVRCLPGKQYQLSKPS